MDVMATRVGRLQRALRRGLTAMALTFILSPWFIRRLKAGQVGQPIREDGPKSHFSKAGTPTMGGSLILFSLVISTLLWCNLTSGFVWVVLSMTVRLRKPRKSNFTSPIFSTIFISNWVTTSPFFPLYKGR